MSKAKITVKIDMDFQVPRVPNFIICSEGGSIDRVSVGELSDDQIDVIGAMWTIDLKARAAEVRSSLSDQEEA